MHSPSGKRRGRKEVNGNITQTTCEILYDILHTSPVAPPHTHTHIHTLRETATVGDFWHVRCCEQVLKGLAVQRKANTDEGNMRECSSQASTSL